MIVQVFTIGLVVSFIGSILPGTLNIIVIQLGLENKLKTALKFALAVALTEYPYAWIAVRFESWITSSVFVQENFKLLAAIVMISLGAIGLWSARKPTGSKLGSFMESGFRKGLILGFLSPQAIPWWIGVVAYLKAEGWIIIDTSLRMNSFVLGTAIGALASLTLLATVSQKLSGFFQNNIYVRFMPGALLLFFGLYAFHEYLS